MSTSNPRSKQTVERVKEFLDQLIANKSVNHEWSSYDAVKLTRWIRDGMKASAYHSEFSSYHTLPAIFILRTRGNKVIAEPRIKGVTLINDTEKIEVTKIYENVISLQTAIGVLISERPSTARFPNWIARDQELLAFHSTYCNNGRYFLINHDDLGITITTIDPGEDIRWTPPLLP